MSHYMRSSVHVSHDLSVCLHKETLSKLAQKVSYDISQIATNQYRGVFPL